MRVEVFMTKEDLDCGLLGYNTEEFVDGYYDSEETMTPPSQLNSTIPALLTAIKFISRRRQVSKIT
jgi:hypothetical protein